MGTYYGNADFTSIRFPERLPNLEREYDEHTGHGSAWSGRWEGMVVAPVTGAVTFHLECNKEAFVTIAGQTVTASRAAPQATLTLSMKKGKAYPIVVKYRHPERTPGYFRLRWSWEDQEPNAIPEDHLFFTRAQATSWNYLPEPKLEEIDWRRYLTVRVKHVIVYDEPGRFAGWPANNGVWSWGDEILVGFVSAVYQKKELHHSVDETKPSLSLLARSLDGGESWHIEDPENFFGDGGRPIARTGDIQFGHPDFALRCNGKLFFVSYDRGRSWKGPYELPDFGLNRKLTSRTDYIVTGPKSCLLFLSTREDSVQARMQDRAFCARTTDGGKTFEFLSWIGDPITVRSVMPSTVRIAENHLVSALRRRMDQLFSNRPQLQKNWIDVYESRDGGKSWRFLSKVADTDLCKHNGNPPSLVRLQDARLCVTYGYRAVPYGIRAKTSNDNGKTWSKEINLRSDARHSDIGYTRSVVRPDGKVVTIYYYTTKERVEQHIAATIWEPPM